MKKRTTVNQHKSLPEPHRLIISQEIVQEFMGFLNCGYSIPLSRRKLHIATGYSSALIRIVLLESALAVDTVQKRIDLDRKGRSFK